MGNRAVMIGRGAPRVAFRAASTQCLGNTREYMSEYLELNEAETALIERLAYQSPGKNTYQVLQL